MGDWGLGVFQNDYALDLAADVHEAQDANQYLMRYFDVFISKTRTGFDSSEYANDWKFAHEVLAACEIVRVSRAPHSTSDVDQYPESVASLIFDNGYRPTAGVVENARNSCAVLAESSWLKEDWPEIWESTFRTVFRQFGV